MKKLREGTITDRYRTFNTEEIKNGEASIQNVWLDEEVVSKTSLEFIIVFLLY